MIWQGFKFFNDIYYQLNSPMTLHNLARLENTSIEFIVLKMDFVETEMPRYVGTGFLLENFRTGAFKLKR